jgi:hypothetical protein
MSERLWRDSSWMVLDTDFTEYSSQLHVNSRMLISPQTSRLNPNSFQCKSGNDEMVITIIGSHRQVFSSLTLEFSYTYCMPILQRWPWRRIKPLTSCSESPPPRKPCLFKHECTLLCVLDSYDLIHRQDERNMRLMVGLRRWSDPMWF